MKHTLLIIALLFSFTFTACKNSENTENSISDTKQTSSEEKIASEEETNTENLKLGFKNTTQYSIAKLYMDLKDALVKSDTYSAKKIAEIMVKYFEEEKDIQLVKEIANNEDHIDIQRQAFFKLSQSLAPIFSSNITSGKLYKQYCPMAFNNEGAFWLSTSKEIMNPYFGDKMLHCGSTKGTIK